MENPHQQAVWPPGAFERNQLIGDRLGFEPLTQCWIGCDGRKLLRTRWEEKDKSEAEAMARMIQHHDKLWNDSLVDFPSLMPDMRGKLVVIVEHWHIRYSDTPGGGWCVVEWLRDRGSVNVASLGAEWRVAFDDGHPHHGAVVETASTMAEAACLVALRVCSKPG